VTAEGRDDRRIQSTSNVTGFAKISLDYGELNRIRREIHTPTSRRPIRAKNCGILILPSPTGLVRP
jgi:hypothetical protein